MMLIRKFFSQSEKYTRKATKSGTVVVTVLSIFMAILIAILIPISSSVAGAQPDPDPTVDPDPTPSLHPSCEPYQTLCEAYPPLTSYRCCNPGEKCIHTPSGFDLCGSACDDGDLQCPPGDYPTYFVCCKPSQTCAAGTFPSCNTQCNSTQTPCQGTGDFSTVIKCCNRGEICNQIPNTIGSLVGTRPSCSVPPPPPPNNCGGCPSGQLCCNQKYNPECQTPTYPPGDYNPDCYVPFGDDPFGCTGYRGKIGPNPKCGANGYCCSVNGTHTLVCQTGPCGGKASPSPDPSPSARPSQTNQTAAGKL